MPLALRPPAAAAGLALALSALSVTAAAPCAAQSIPSVALPGTQVRQLKSRNTGREYDIYVAAPGGSTAGATTRYPVLYILDGQWDFKLMVSVYGGLVYDRYVPPMVLVGITYSGSNPDYGALRAMDYTPWVAPDVRGSGDGPKFLAFLRDELIPFVESNYPADPAQRMLMGASYGGLFTLYALLSDPHLFSGYLAGSPAVPYASNGLFKQEAEYFAQHKDLPARVWISVGGAEPLLTPDQDFIRVLQSRHYSGLTLGTRVVEGERHSGNKPESFNRGLRFIFQDYQPPQ